MKTHTRSKLFGAFGAVGTLAACGAGLLCAASPAQAQSAREFWHNEWARQQRSYEPPPFRQYYPPRRGWFDPPQPLGYAEWSPPSDEPRSRPERSRPERSLPQVHVSNPDFLDYAPDRPSVITLREPCEIKTAANTQTPADAKAQSAGDSATPAAAPSVPPSLFARACAVSPSISLRALPQVGKAIVAYYSDHPQFLWSDQGRITPKAMAAMAALAASDRFGLNPRDYTVQTPDLNSAADAETKLKALLRFDFALSAKVLTYVLDATRGRIDPDRLSGYHDLPRKKVDLVAALGAIAQSANVAEFLEKRNPDNAQFRALVAALADLQAGTQKQPVQIAAGTSIAPGGSDPELANVVAALRQTASPALQEKYGPVLAASSDAQTYSGKLVEAVKQFQRENGLGVDGVIGKNTIAALTRHDSNADKIAKLRLAMERLRWLPSRFGARYVFLNEPAYEVSYFNGSGKPLTMRAIVGRPDAQTYFFTDHIKNVQYNPYWNVPRSIVINEMLPKLYRNPSYLDNRGYEVRNARGRQIASNDVDWGAVATDQVGVDVRQPPGRENALGRVKIEFPNKHAIYMHDTNEKHLFSHATRALSHGCVRLQHPREMAAALLGTDVSHVDRKIASEDTQSESVPGDIPVYLAYFTAWPDTDGAVHYYKDVYDRDAHLAKAIAKTEAARKQD